MSAIPSSDKAPTKATCQISSTETCGNEGFTSYPRISAVNEKCLAGLSVPHSLVIKKSCRHYIRPSCSSVWTGLSTMPLLRNVTATTNADSVSCNGWESCFLNIGHGNVPILVNLLLVVAQLVYLVSVSCNRKNKHKPYWAHRSTLDKSQRILERNCKDSGSS